MSDWSTFLVLALVVAYQQQLADATELEESVVVVGECEVNLFRLPTRVQPTNYHLQLWLNPESVDFIGQVIIDLNIRDTMDSEEFLQSRTIGREVPPSALDPRSIILNVDGLQVIRWEFKQNNIPWGVESICRDAENNILVVTLEKELIPEPDTQLILNFKGEVQTDGKGLFTSDVQSSKALTSNFVPTYARRLFPCFDEPEFKATFRLTIWHPSGTIALSNMRVSKYDIPTTGFVGTFFEPTPKISSCLLSIAVGYFRPAKMASLEDGTEITLYVPDGFKFSVSDIFNRAKQAYIKVTHFFDNLPIPPEDHTKETDSLDNIPKPLNKIDIVAVESDCFATDSLGLIIMKWDLIIMAEKLTSPQLLVYVNHLLMTVMVQQRLVNLVTLRWWDKLWLIVGLSRYLASELTTEPYQEVSSELLTLVEVTASAMEDDDNPEMSHPIKSVVFETPRDDFEKSSHLNIGTKSESIFRMFSRYIGKEKFDWAVRDFIISHAYQVVDAKDWWDTLSRYASESDNLIGEAHLWTEQAGYPIIYVSLTEGDRLHVSQKSSLRNGQVWPVPITLKLYGDPKGKKFYLVELVLSKSGPIEIDLPDWFNLEDEFQWLKLNLDYAGYYRVVYESDLLREALARAVKKGWMSASDRLQLLNDSYAHGKRSGSMKEFEKLLKSFSGEKEDGLMLLLTRLLTSQEKLSPDLRQLVNKLMKQYHDMKGGVSGPAGMCLLTQCARGEVMYYLVNTLENEVVKDELKEYTNYVMSNNVQWPGFLNLFLDVNSEN